MQLSAGLADSSLQNGILVLHSFLRLLLHT